MKPMLMMSYCLLINYDSLCHHVWISIAPGELHNGMYTSADWRRQQLRQLENYEMQLISNLYIQKQ